MSAVTSEPFAWSSRPRCCEREARPAIEAVVMGIQSIPMQRLNAAEVEKFSKRVLRVDRMRIRRVYNLRMSTSSLQLTYAAGVTRGDDLELRGWSDQNVQAATAVAPVRRTFCLRSAVGLPTIRTNLICHRVAMNASITTPRAHIA
jgi:hypothetical protein